MRPAPSLALTFEAPTSPGSKAWLRLSLAPGRPARRVPELPVPAFRFAREGDKRFQGTCCKDCFRPPLPPPSLPLPLSLPSRPSLPPSLFSARLCALSSPSLFFHSLLSHLPTPSGAPRAPGTPRPSLTPLLSRPLSSSAPLYPACSPARSLSTLGSPLFLSQFPSALPRSSACSPPCPAPPWPSRRGPGRALPPSLSLSPFLPVPFRSPRPASLPSYPVWPRGSRFAPPLRALPCSPGPSSASARLLPCVPFHCRLSPFTSLPPSPSPDVVLPATVSPLRLSLRASPQPVFSVSLPRTPPHFVCFPLRFLFPSFLLAPLSCWLPSLLSPPLQSRSLFPSLSLPSQTSPLALASFPLSLVSREAPPRPAPRRGPELLSRLPA
ncbi:vegetative cell wall protein gp1-like [Panthera leo]|uniref:vegetative cell wall protein gp1-like n=1 Tax=Panthera leo TaxID=9689 RepID=UPI001C69FBFE|nr:vegetative cell wall protein gp1-like [Panthera leo]